MKKLDGMNVKGVDDVQYGRVETHGRRILLSSCTNMAIRLSIDSISDEMSNHCPSPLFQEHLG